MRKITPKKRFGQHFLKDLSIAERIADTIYTDVKNVLEVGPGMGALTQFLLNNQDIDLKAVEVDMASYDYLQEKYPQLKIFREDFLKMDFSQIFANQTFGIIGNFPYNISTQILFKILENRDRVSFFAGMFQKEVAERICAANGSKTYGITSVLAQAFYKVEYILTVFEHVFVPPPKVKSAVIRLTRNEVKKLNCNEKLFFDVVKTAFNQRRKTLRNSLKSFEARSCPSNKLKTTIYKNDITDYNTESNNYSHNDIFNLRPEQLSVTQFIYLTNLIEERINQNHSLV
ncbi:MAG: 16S rRNA (adenine(1518)-N(6)/adenine(1519)-N(6))-dimethyltransferase RsmA [Prevotellaceae bacterium]|jgi:16S rRNA (adenine1518-N6/adenine1519-N6)-dimethyltransferase|nr:16S rRNA (adenine(1518)-N(6)/adenine(1519)-N(6))-dimethyltransferase RsmA [Prevotellaceae bacterium]